MRPKSVPNYPLNRTADFSQQKKQRLRTPLRIAGKTRKRHDGETA